jgi:hypothetical protein
VAPALLTILVTFEWVNYVAWPSTIKLTCAIFVTVLLVVVALVALYSLAGE